MTVVAIFGPTGSGKTAVAEALADRVDGELVSADSMQVYDGVPILTDQSSRPTRLVAVWPLSHEGSIAEYARLAHAAIDEIRAAGRTPIVVGGSGLYLRAALAELRLPPAPGPGSRERWQDVYDREGAARAHAILAEADPATAATVHANDRRRLVRALELAEAGASLKPAEDRLWSARTRHPTLIFGLHLPKAELERRIAIRTRRMFERGVEDEVRRAVGGPISATAAQVLGLREIRTLARERAIEEIGARTRRYASYQRKWMRRIPGLVEVAADRPPESIAGEIVAYARAGDPRRATG